ncbi:hypothetical protein NKH77_06195 [Streptomyces sp. M19]
MGHPLNDLRDWLPAPLAEAVAARESAARNARRSPADDGPDRLRPVRHDVAGTGPYSTGSGPYSTGSTPPRPARPAGSDQPDRPDRPVPRAVRRRIRPVARPPEQNGAACRRRPRGAGPGRAPAQVALPDDDHDTGPTPAPPPATARPRTRRRPARRNRRTGPSSGPGVRAALPRDSDSAGVDFDVPRVNTSEVDYDHDELVIGSVLMDRWEFNTPVGKGLGETRRSASRAPSPTCCPSRSTTGSSRTSSPSAPCCAPRPTRGTWRC